MSAFVSLKLNSNLGVFFKKKMPHRSTVLDKLHTLAFGCKTIGPSVRLQIKFGFT